MPQRTPSRSQPRRSPDTNLVRYLDKDDNWNDSVERGLCPPIEDSALLHMGRNSVRGSANNNDGLEFVGDRVTNLACDLLVDKAKTTDLQYRVVCKALSNNDTLGRLARRLRLHENASFGDPEEKESVTGWSPQCGIVPPKAMADLFEAHVGAVYVEKGWQAVLTWFTNLYAPLVPAAEGDFLGKHPGPNGVRLVSQQFDGPPEILDFQSRLLDALTLSALTLIKKAQELIRHMPSSTIFSFNNQNGLANESRLELIGHDVINLWVCKICLQLSPGVLKATSHAAHLMTWITYLTTNNETMSILAAFLGMASYFDKSDPHYHPFSPITDIKDVEKVTGGFEDKGYKKKLALALKAAIAGFYLLDEEAASEWGEGWFKMIVTEAHGFLVNHPNYRLPGASCQTAWTDIPRKKPRTSTGPSHDSPSRESRVPESSTPRKRPRTSLRDVTRESENIPPSHSATPNVKKSNQVAAHSPTPQRLSSAKPIQSPSLKRVGIESMISFQLTDKENTRKSKFGSPSTTPSSSRMKRKLSFTNDQPAPPFRLNAILTASTISHKSLNKEDPFA